MYTCSRGIEPETLPETNPADGPSGNWTRDLQILSPASGQVPLYYLNSVKKHQAQTIKVLRQFTKLCSTEWTDISGGCRTRSQDYLTFHLHLQQLMVTQQETEWSRTSWILSYNGCAHDISTMQLLIINCISWSVSLYMYFRKICKAALCYHLSCQVRAKNDQRRKV